MRASLIQSIPSASIVCGRVMRLPKQSSPMVPMARPPTTNRRLHALPPSAPSPSSSLPEAPGVSTNEPPRGEGTPSPSPREPEPNQLKVLWSRGTRAISSLSLAIAELGLIAGASAVGTFIEQGKSLEFYQTFYPDGDKKVLGFLTYDIILGLGIDHIYSTPYFAALVGALGASLIACTLTRQWPIVKVAQRWRFLQTSSAVLTNPIAETLPNARLSDLGSILSKDGFQVFRKGGQLYAFKGLSGRYAPIGVHIALILTLVGAMMGAFGEWRGSVIAPESSQFVVAQYINPASPLATLPKGAAAAVRVNDFRIDYLDNGDIDQFYSDLSVLDLEGNELQRKTIFVNEPLRFGGITAYQTDWAIAGLVLKVQGSAAVASAGEPGSDGFSSISLPMASLENSGAIQGRAWGAFLPVDASQDEGGKARGITCLARDFNTVAFYDSKGEFAGIRRPGSGNALTVEGVTILVSDVIGSTGLELKADPGVPVVYAGFGLMMITTLLSYLTFSQVWALQEGENLHVGAKTNRATVEFQIEMDAMLDAVPERI